MPAEPVVPHARWMVWAAFAAVYTIWGSTYLAIRVAVETLPPFLMGGVRFVIAGGVLYAWTRLRGAPRPRAIHWRSAAIVGGLLLLGGNGGVCWAEQRVSSGVAALLVSAVPFWMVFLNWARPRGVRPGAVQVVGLVVGFLGVTLLINPGSANADSAVDLWGAGALIVASLLWATGSLYSRRAPQPASQLQATAMQMLAGGVLLSLTAIASGEWTNLNASAVSLQSLVALAYLIVFGALVGFTAYIWLLRASTPARVSTYAYVNPVVAVVLGWWLLDEPLGPRTFGAMAIIVMAVVLITTYRNPAVVRPGAVRRALATVEG
ncbi:MAG: drug/metabolite exporter YedA [Phycisphaerae bacterium]